MLRLALPLVCGAALLWQRSDGAPAPRAALAARTVVTAEPPWYVAAGPQSGLGHPKAVPDMPHPPPDAVPDASERNELRQHDVRDLVAMGLAMDEVASRVEHEAGAEKGSVTTRVNVLEVLAPEAIQLRVEHALEERRRIGTCTLRIHPVADLVMTVQEYEQLQASLRDSTSLPCDAFEALPTQPFEIESLVDVILQTIGEGVMTIRPQGNNLVVLAQPAAQYRIAGFLDDLRSDGEEPEDDSRR